MYGLYQSNHVIRYIFFLLRGLFSLLVTGRDWGQEEKGMTEDEVAGLHHRLNGHEFEQAPGVGDGQGSLVC